MLYNESIPVGRLQSKTPKLLPGLLDDSSERLTKKLPVSHIFIVSAYYYPRSKSMGQNAVALNMVIDGKNFNVEQATFNIVGSNGTNEKVEVANLQSENVINCRYAPAVILINTISNINKLEMESDGIKIEISFKMARYTAPNPVIICISPQVIAEQWQLFIMQVHVALRFGAHIHIYLISIIESFFELMKEYERQWYLTIDFWLKMKFAQSDSPYFEPNINTELSNQAGAYTDCLLQYKEAAKYIAFFDLDDFLFPAMHSTYLQEFNAEWKYQENLSSVYYFRKEHKFAKAKSLSEFSFYDIFSSLKSLKTQKEGRLVVKPDRHISSRILSLHHASPRNGNAVYRNSIIHLQSIVQNISTDKKMDSDPFTGKIRPKDIIAMEEDIWRIRNLSQIAEIAVKLPNSDFYSPIVSQCLFDYFHLQSADPKTDPKNCPSVEMCEIPKKDEYGCVHSDAEYISGHRMESFMFHFTNNSFWSWDIGCYQSVTLLSQL